MANYATSSLKLSDTYVNTLPYNTCSTAAGTAAKTVSAGDFALETGAMVVVKFTNTNTAANPTLNVSSTGAKAIYYKGATIPASYLNAHDVYQFVYNGTQWDLIGDIDHTHDDRYYTESEIDTKLSGKLNTTGGTLTGALSISGEQIDAIQLTNSNITGLNKLVFADATNSSSEGIFFPRTDGTGTDVLRADNGALIFSQNGTDRTVIHSSILQAESWECPTTVNSWSKVCTFNDYASFLLTITMSQNSQANVFTYLVNTGYQGARIVQLGANSFSANNTPQVRITSSTAIAGAVEIYNNFGYNGATSVTFSCEVVKLSKSGTITPTTENTPVTGSPTVWDSLTSNAYSMVGSLIDSRIPTFSYLDGVLTIS